MIILKIIEEYYASADIDLQYMALRNDLTVSDLDNDISLLMNKLILPILADEQSMTIVNLVCYELLPRFLQAMRDAYKPSKEIFRLTETKIFVPLMRNLSHESRSLVFLQSLRVTFRKIRALMAIDDATRSKNRNVNVPVVIFNSNDQFVRDLLDKILQQGLFHRERVVCYEMLNHLVQLYYDGHTHAIPRTILGTILKECAQDDTLEPLVEELASNLCLLTSAVNLGYNSAHITDTLLLTMSKHWFKFNTLADEYFDTRLLPRLEVDTLDDTRAFLNILRIIANFKPYYSTRILHAGLPYLAQDNVTRLITDLIMLINKFDIRISERRLEIDILAHSSGHINEIHSDGGDGNDPAAPRATILTSRPVAPHMEKQPSAQDSYLQELSLANDTYAFGGADDDDDNDIMFEEEEDSNIMDDDSEQSSAHPSSTLAATTEETEAEIQRIKEIHEMILEIIHSIDISPNVDSYFMNTEKHLLNSTYRSLNLKVDEKAIVTLFQFSPDVKEIDLREVLTDDKYYEKYTKEDIFRTLDYKSASSMDDLKGLQLVVDIAEKLMRDKNFGLTVRDQSILSLILLPHAKRNKQFICIIKVGNMKQKVDEGVSTRTSIYSILSQMEKLPMNVSCKILEDMAGVGLKDKNENVKFIAEKVMENILEQYYEAIIALAQNWYQVSIMDNMREVLYGSPNISASESWALSNLIDTYPSASTKPNM